jgi:hypothetical protein
MARATLNYRAGFARIYLVLTVVWIGWGLYKPAVDREKAMNSLLETANRLRQDCVEETTEIQRKHERRMEEWVLRGGLQPQDPVLRDCDGPMLRSTASFESYARERLEDTYYRVGYRKIAAYCLIPPTTAWLAIALAVRLTRWIADGFVVRGTGGVKANKQGQL